MVRARLSDWQLMPSLVTESALETPPVPIAPAEPQAEEPPAGGSVESSLAEAQQPVESRAVVEAAGSGVILDVGKTIAGFRPRDLRLNISDTRLTQLNIGVVGDLGTGKTQILKSLIAQIASSGAENRDRKSTRLNSSH